jgi:transcriptional regulator with XRE-family HTH domain
MNNEKSLFAQRLITAMQAKGYDPKPSILEREFNLRHNGKPVTLYGVRKWLLGMSMPSSDKLLTLAKWLDVPPEELAFEKDIKKRLHSVMPVGNKTLVIKIKTL